MNAAGSKESEEGTEEKFQVKNFTETKIDEKFLENDEQLKELVEEAEHELEELNR